jgi:Ribosome recycling factor
MSVPLAEQVQITLRSFLRKTVNSYLLKADIRKTGAKLMRKGRSRNWVLQANNEQMLQIIELIERSEQTSWLWLIKVLTEQRQQLTEHELLNIVKRNPSITLNQLISLTNCTHSEARAVLDLYEWR